MLPVTNEFLVLSGVLLNASTSSSSRLPVTSGRLGSCCGRCSRTAGSPGRGSLDNRYAVCPVVNLTDSGVEEFRDFSIA